jgi:predicted membrane channel-forming protein YqfA (hemolysin III family)
MVFYEEIWFWVFIIGILLFIIGVIFYDYDRNTDSNETPFWVWVLLLLGVIMVIISLILYALSEPSTLEKCCGSWRYTNNSQTSSQLGN